MKTRIKRVNSEFQKAAIKPISDIVNKEYPGTIVSVTKVDTNEDLSESRISVSVFSAGNRADGAAVVGTITQNAHVVRDHIARAVNLRITPRLRFILDDSVDQTQRISDMINKINNK